MYLECVQDTHCHCTYLCCVQQRRCGVELEVDFVPFVGTGLVCKEQFHLAAEDSRLHAGLQLSIKWKHLCRWKEAIIIITVHTAHAHSVGAERERAGNSNRYKITVVLLVLLSTYLPVELQWAHCKRTERRHLPRGRGRPISRVGRRAASGTFSRRRVTICA